VLPFYVPKPKSELFAIWERTKSRKEEIELAEDERVEDAGLDQDEDAPPEGAAAAKGKRAERAAA
jgi:hypothetical protein